MAPLGCEIIGIGVGCGNDEVTTVVPLNTGAEATGAIGAGVGVMVGVAVGRGVSVGTDVWVGGGVKVHVGGSDVDDTFVGATGDDVGDAVAVGIAVGDAGTNAVGVTTTTIGCALVACQAYRPPSKSSTSPKAMSHLKERIQSYISFLIDV